MLTYIICRLVTYDNGRIRRSLGLNGNRFHKFVLKKHTHTPQIRFKKTHTHTHTHIYIYMKWRYTALTECRTYGTDCLILPILIHIHKLNMLCRVQ